MAVVVIGGQASGVGKTGVVCALIAAMPERRWTAIKITQCNHENTQCSDDVAGAKVCDCKLDGRAFAITEERDTAAGTDTSRYLAAGAARSLWVRTRRGHLVEAMPQMHDEIARAANVVIESNSILDFLKPDLYAVVLSPGVGDFKRSARRFLDRADAILMAAPAAGRTANEAAWRYQLGELGERLAWVPRFEMAQPRLLPAGFVTFAAERMDARTG